MGVPWQHCCGGGEFLRVAARTDKGKITYFCTLGKQLFDGFAFVGDLEGPAGW